jgi:hypothetical protein
MLVVRATASHLASHLSRAGSRRGGQMWASSSWRLMSILRPMRRREWLLVSVAGLLACALAGTSIALANQSVPEKARHSLPIQVALPRIPTCPNNPSNGFMPRKLTWCTSACSSYVDDVSWTSWTRASAIGTGTLMTNDGIPNCAGGHWTAHRQFRVIWSDPQPFCERRGQVTGYLFLRSNIWRGTFEGLSPQAGCRA